MLPFCYWVKIINFFYFYFFYFLFFFTFYFFYFFIYFLFFLFIFFFIFFLGGGVFDRGFGFWRFLRLDFWFRWKIHWILDFIKSVWLEFLSWILDIGKILLDFGFLNKIPLNFGFCKIREIFLGFGFFEKLKLDPGFGSKNNWILGFNGLSHEDLA